ncbi:uncharacterized protein LOC135401464 isoform X2 [Ornithodoros turicata]|uniref:uncharacterized protein LOC135401464 isoform X2 n=1 Tax=Ornithodoros turicata TaxID=34597 RepID=UPI00313A231B
MANALGVTALWIMLCSLLFSARDVAGAYYMEDYCGSQVSVPVPLLGEASSEIIGALKDTVERVKEPCASSLHLQTVAPAQLGIVIEELNTFKDPNENFCINYVDMHPLESFLTRFCGLLEDLAETSDASEGNELDILWNRATVQLEEKGLQLAITAFILAENGKCPENMYHCTNGRCIDQRWRCDSVNNCGDNSDESECTGMNSSAMRKASLLLVVVLTTLVLRR